MDGAVMNDNPQAHMRAAAASAHREYVPPPGEYAKEQARALIGLAGSLDRPVPEDLAAQELAERLDEYRAALQLLADEVYGNGRPAIWTSARALVTTAIELLQGAKAYGLEQAPVATSPVERIAEALERLAAAFEQPQGHVEHPPVFVMHMKRADGLREDITRTDLPNGMVAFERTIVTNYGTVVHKDGPIEAQRGDSVTWPPFRVSWS